jgi:RNA polymerase sigma-70 factor (ECF subfamily)
MDQRAPEPPGLPDLPALVDAHYMTLYRYAYRLCGSEADAADLTQQTFLTAQANLEQLRDPEAVRSWLFTITRNNFLKSKRAQRTRRTVSLEGAAEPLDGCPSFSRIEQEELQAVLDELPEEFRTPLILFYFQEFSYKQIARQMDVPIGTVMSRLARAKDHLRRRLLPEPDANPLQAGSAVRQDE